MKEFLLRKKSIIGKFAVNQIAFSVFGIMVSSAILVFSSQFVLYAGIFSALFYLTLIYSSAYYDGEKDAISCEGGSIEYMPLSGLYYALIQYIPTIIIVILNVVFRLLISDTLISAIFNVITRIAAMGMYMGIDIHLRSIGPSLEYISNLGVFFAVFLIIYPLVSCLGYYFGLKNIHLFNKIKE